MNMLRQGKRLLMAAVLGLSFPLTVLAAGPDGIYRLGETNEYWSVHLNADGSSLIVAAFFSSDPTERSQPSRS